MFKMKKQDNLKHIQSKKGGLFRAIGIETRYNLGLKSIITALLILITPMFVGVLPMIFMKFESVPTTVAIGGGATIDYTSSSIHALLYSNNMGGIAQNIAIGAFLITTARLMITFRNRSTVDKNRVAFMLNKRNHVTIAQAIVESLEYLISIVLYIFAVALVTMIKGQAGISIVLMEKWLPVLPSFILINLLLQSVSSWLLSKIDKSSLALLLSMIIIMGSFAIMWLFEYLKVFESTFKNSHLAMGFVPIFNWAYISHFVSSAGIVFEGNNVSMENLYFTQVLVADVELLAMIIAIWNPMSKAKKAYLVA